MRGSIYYNEIEGIKSINLGSDIEQEINEFIKSMKEENKDIKEHITTNEVEQFDKDYSLLDQFISFKIPNPKEQSLKSKENLTGMFSSSHEINNDKIINIYYENVFASQIFYIKDNVNVELNIFYIDKPSYVSRHFFIGNNCSLNINTYVINHSFIENRTIINFKGEKSNVNERVACLLNIKNEEKQHTGGFRFYTQLNHINKRNFSNSIVNAVLLNHASCSIEGMINIYPYAEQSDAFLEQNALMLSEHAKAYSYPSLEIQNNNVKATHASSLRQIEKEDLFYLRSRGLSYKDSYIEIVKSFLSGSCDITKDKHFYALLENIISKNIEDE